MSSSDSSDPRVFHPLDSVALFRRAQARLQAAILNGGYINDDEGYGSDSSSAMSHVTILAPSRGGYSREALPSRSYTAPPPGPVQHGCLICSSIHSLKVCKYCHCAYFCPVHYGVRWNDHLVDCDNIRKAYRVWTRYRYWVDNFPDYYDYERSDSGVPERQADIALRACGHARAATKTSLGMTKAVESYYNSSKEPCTTNEFFEERFYIPKTHLRLGNLEECYHYVKFWTQFAGLRQSWVNVNEYKQPVDGTNFWEDTCRPILPRGGGTTLNCLLTVMMIKLSLLLNLQEMQSIMAVATMVGLPAELVRQIGAEIMCETLHKYCRPRREDGRPDLKNRRDRPCAKLRKEVSQLAGEIMNGNPYFWDIFQYRNVLPWYRAGPGKEEQERPRGVRNPSPSSLENRGSIEEAVFTVYNNKEVLAGHLGSAVECVFLKNGVRGKNGRGLELYGPGQGWLS